MYNWAKCISKKSLVQLISMYIVPIQNPYFLLIFITKYFVGHNAQIAIEHTAGSLYKV